MPQSPLSASAHIVAHISSWPVFPNLEAETTLSFASGVTALIGRNGTGKTRFARLLTGEEHWPGAEVTRLSRIGYLPQMSVPPGDLSIAEHLGVAEGLRALEKLEQGVGSEDDLTRLNDRWTLRLDINAALGKVGLKDLDPGRPVSDLSGGEFTRIELARLELSGPEFLVLDEPTNHLDTEARAFVVAFIKAWDGGMLVVSHDRQVLRAATRVLELSSLGLKSHRGTYDDFLACRTLEREAAQRSLESAAKRVKHIRQEAQASQEKAARRAQTGKKQRRDGSHGKSLLDGKLANSEVSAGKRQRKTAEVLGAASQELKDAAGRIERYQTLSLDLPSSGVKAGQGLLRLEDLSFSYGKQGEILFDDLSLALKGGEKIALTGPNGSGKSTLLKLIGGRIDPADHRSDGRIVVTTSRLAYLDQKTELLESAETIFDAFRSINRDARPGQIHAALARFLFRADDAFKRIEHLSGGERLRAALAALLYSPEPPQLLLLDEPDNHLDLDSQIAAARALAAFDGGILIVSHDEAFLADVGVTGRMALD